MPFKYIGRITHFEGKTLWEIVGNLRNYGIGRYVIRNIFQRYPEQSFMKIVKVETFPNPLEYSYDNPRRVKVWVEKTFRGRKHPELVVISLTSYKPDYKLIPKDEEEKFITMKECGTKEKIFPSTTEFPPLLKELIKQEADAKGEVLKEDPKLKIVYRQARESIYRVAKEGETANMEFATGLGTPASPSLYEGIKLQ